MEALIGFIALFATIFGVLYVHYSTRNKERMALIEKGADASLFNTGKEGAIFKFSWSKFTLKLGMLAIGISIGIFLAALMAPSGFMDEDALYPSLIFFFGGLSLVVFYMIDRKGL
jgi:hypothetical protein